MADALKQELALLSSTRREAIFFNGERVGSFAGWHYYRFEIPEEIFAHRIEFARLSIGRGKPWTMNGKIVGFENQYLTIALPYDLGPMLPETLCQWSYEDHFQPIVSALGSLDATSAIPSSLFHPTDEKNRHAVSFEPEMIPTVPPNQQEAIKKIFQNHITYLWGPILSGKTHLLALLVANFIKAGKKVLFLSNSNDGVDSMMLRTIDIGKQLSVDVTPKAARVGLPFLVNSEALAAVSFEQQVETKKEEKRKIFQERVKLLEKYFATRVKQIFHEDVYAKIAEIRQKATEKKAQIDRLTQEIGQLRQALDRIQNASIMDRLKKGFTKEDQAATQKQLDEKQATLKRLQTVHSALTSEAVRMESEAPIPFEEQKEFQQTLKRIDELGGLDKVIQAVNEFIAQDERGMLSTKQFVATTVTTALSDPRLQGMHFDLVVVDDAETIGLPFLATLSTFAKDKMVVAGDPFQLGPGSLSTNQLADDILQKDIFLHVAQTNELHRLFDWTEEHPQWAILLSSQFATTPKLSVFAASILFDNKINVFASPTAKGHMYFIDTSSLKSQCKQYLGRKRILPYNDLQTRRVIELVKHALLEPGRSARDIGVILPFHGPTLYTKLQLRLNGMTNIEVGTPQTFRGRRKKAIIFDMVMAGVDYTIKHIDDRKIGEHQIARMFNTVLSCVVEDLYVVADMSHFMTVYKDRLLTRLLMLLQSESESVVAYQPAVKKFDEMEWDKRLALFDLSGTGAVAVSKKGTEPSKEDAELALKMKMLSKQQGEKPQPAARNVELETAQAATRALAYLTDVNLLTQYLGSPLLFRQSYSTVSAARRLPRDLCQNEKDFRANMERWNLLIYEMSGGQKAEQTFFSKSAVESRIRWDINSLKAFYSSDVEAMIEEGKQKIAVAVSKIFQETLGRPQATNPQEWSTVYLNFLSRVEGYLSWISEQLRK